MRPIDQAVNRARSFLLGVGLVAVGLWMVFPPAAPIAIGTLLIAASVRAEAQEQIRAAMEARRGRLDEADRP